MSKENVQVTMRKNNGELPLVSICCVTYNHEKYIADAIEGFLMQKTDFPIEVIIHDDASTDQTTEIIRAYEQKYPEIIKPIYQTENQYSKGIKRMIMLPIEKAMGKYIALCEGDDYWIDPYKLKKQVDYLESNPDCTLCTHATNTIIFNGDNGKFDPPFHQNTEFYFEDVLQNRTSVHGIGHTSSLVFPSKILKDLPDWYYKAPTGDTPLKMFCTIKGHGYYINENMSNYRRGITGSWNERIRGNNRKLKETMIENLEMFESVNRYTDFKYNEIIETKFLNYRKTIEYLDNIISNGEKWIIFILDIVNKYRLNNIAIFGVEHAGLEVMSRLEENNIRPRAFFDNYRSGKEINKIPIFHPSVLEEDNNYDFVIITVLGDHYLEIEKQIALYNSTLKYISVRNIE